jgi:hypothetical protein
VPENYSIQRLTCLWIPLLNPCEEAVSNQSPLLGGPEGGKRAEPSQPRLTSIWD